MTEPTSSQKGTGLAPNIASLLCYICTPITGIIFILLEKEDKEVQFHAWQATTFGLGYIAVVISLEIFSAILGAIVSFIGVVVGLLVPLAGLIAFIIWIIALIKAYQGEHWKIPYIGDFAEKKVGSV